MTCVALITFFAGVWVIATAFLYCSGSTTCGRATASTGCTSGTHREGGSRSARSHRRRRDLSRADLRHRVPIGDASGRFSRLPTKALVLPHRVLSRWARPRRRRWRSGWRERPWKLRAARSTGTTWASSSRTSAIFLSAYVLVDDANIGWLASTSGTTCSTCWWSGW